MDKSSLELSDLLVETSALIRFLSALVHDGERPSAERHVLSGRLLEALTLYARVLHEYETTKEIAYVQRTQSRLWGEIHGELE